MKKNAFLVASAVVCASASVFADNVQGDNVFGVMAVSSKAAYTLVAVPWCECSTNDNQAVAISNIVKTANLTVGDKIHAVIGNPTNIVSTWELKDSGGVKYWDKTVTVVEGGSGNGLSADKAHIDRGYAVILYRSSPTNSNGTAKLFYLYGQVGTQSSITTRIATGSSETPAYTLIAPPGTSEADLLAEGVLSGMGNGDQIVTRSVTNSASRTYTYDGTDWKYDNVTFSDGKITATPTSASVISIQPGSGAWYVSRSGSEPTLTWTSVPKK